MGHELIPFAVAVTWAGVCAQWLVVPFYNKVEKLHQDYSAELNAALGKIEGDKLIPRLAAMFELCREAQADKRTKIVMAELLEQVDFLPELEGVEAASQEKRWLKDSYALLGKLAKRIWIIGLIHVLFSLCVSASWVISLPMLPLEWVRFMSEDEWTFLIRLLILIGWLATLIEGVRCFFRFHSRMESFVNALESTGVETSQ